MRPYKPPGPINEDLLWRFKVALMSDSPEDIRPEQATTSSSSSSNGAGLPPSTFTGGNNDRGPAPIEKTISCVSCRKRKLKCDRIKPKCGTCSRLRHECEYPERRRNAGSKRRNMKELEARLAQVETQLISETTKNASPRNEAQPSSMVEPDWNNYPLDMNMNMDFEADPILDFSMPESTYTFQPQIPGDFFSQEIISLGLAEPLPPEEMMADLYQLYFDKFHYTLPLIHKSRFLASLHHPSHMQPPVCLRYAIWATAASISDKYATYEDALYERARRYIQEAEMKGHGEAFVTVQHAQTWSLIGTYEAKKTYFTRAWMSSGRTVRLCHMLGLHRLDGEGQDVKRILPPSKDWIELEERRRTFWAAFYGDRWASSGTGWPMIIDEKTIMTNLPASEEAFENGTIQNTVSLSKALTPEGASQITPFGGVILSACLFGHNFQHLHQTGADERPDDIVKGEFWNRHRKMDNVLSNTFMFLPDHLRLPNGLRDMNIVFLHMNIHASTICLHQAAVLTAERNKINPTFIRQSRARSLMAAEEIANIMRLISHFDAANMNSWMGFCLYVASGVFIQDLRSDDSNSQTQTNLSFILSAMRAIGNRHSITQHFTAQVELDIESSGINKFYPSQFYPEDQLPREPRNLMVGVMSTEASDKPGGANPVCMPSSRVRSHNLPTPGSQRPLLGIFMSEPRLEPKNPLFESLYGVLPRSGTLGVVAAQSPSAGSSNGSSPNNLNGNFVDTQDALNTQTRTSSTPSGSGSVLASPATATVRPFATQYVSQPADVIDSQTSSYNQSTPGDGSINMQSFDDPSLGFALNTDSPGLSNTTRPTQYPYRGVDPSNHSESSYGMYPPTTNDQTEPPNPNGWVFDPKIPRDICPMPSNNG